MPRQGYKNQESRVTNGKNEPLLIKNGKCARTIQVVPDRGKGS